MSRRKIQGFLESRSYNHPAKKNIIKGTIITIIMCGVIPSIMGIYTCKSIYLYIYCGITIGTACINLIAWKNEKSLLWGGTIFLLIAEGITLIILAVIFGKTGLPQMYHLPIFLIYFITLGVLICTNVKNINNEIRSGRYTGGYSGVYPKGHTPIAGTGIKATGLGGPLALLFKRNVEAGMIMLTICMFILMYLVLEFVVELFMVQYYEQHIDNYSDNLYRVHKRRPIHRN